MKFRNVLSFVVIISIVLTLMACSKSSQKGDIPVSSVQTVGQVYLYGETHGVKKILEKEFELWNGYYHDQDMRHLFLELPYYTAEFLNIWMKSDSNEILDMIYEDSAGVACHTPDVKAFYEKIKNECPKTIFHGTDVGHQYNSTGERFLQYLRSNNLENSEQYQRTNEAIGQGKSYEEHYEAVYRENAMVENFKREFDKLSGESIMGIYGAKHTGLDAMDYTNAIPCMANQLKECYGDIIHSEDLSSLEKDIEPYRIDRIHVNGKDYEALYFGEQDTTSFSKDYKDRKFWRLENAYDDFKNTPKGQQFLPYSEYPMQIEKGQVFVIDYTKTDGTVIRQYYRSDGVILENEPSTEEFIVE